MRFDFRLFNFACRGFDSIGFNLLANDSRPTVCVTRVGAGGGTPSDWKNAEA
jgi:hypothetical protein